MGKTSPILGLEPQILGVLEDGEKTSRGIAAALNIEEKQLLETIRRMLEDGKLMVGKQNKYGIKH